MILKTGRVWAILKYRRCFTTVSFFLSQNEKKKEEPCCLSREFANSVHRMAAYSSEIPRVGFCDSVHNHTISRTMQEIENIFFKNYPHRFVQPLRIPNVSITESYSLSLLPSSQRARDRIHPQFLRVPINQHTKKVVAKGS